MSYHGYHICPPTFIFGEAVALLQESYTLVQRNSHVFLALSDRAFVSDMISLISPNTIL